MSRGLTFLPEAWDDYLYWQRQDTKTIRRINQLLQSIMRDPFTGIGKPEQLKGDKANLWSRRIDDTNRVLYRIMGSNVEIVHCRSHYDM